LKLASSLQIGTHMSVNVAVANWVGLIGEKLSYFGLIRPITSSPIQCNESAATTAESPHHDKRGGSGAGAARAGPRLHGRRLLPAPAPSKSCWSYQGVSRIRPDRGRRRAPRPAPAERAAAGTRPALARRWVQPRRRPRWRPHRPRHREGNHPPSTPHCTHLSHFSSTAQSQPHQIEAQLEMTPGSEAPRAEARAYAARRGSAAGDVSLGFFSSAVCWHFNTECDGGSGVLNTGALRLEIAGGGRAHHRASRVR